MSDWLLCVLACLALVSPIAVQLVCMQFGFSKRITILFLLVSVSVAFVMQIYGHSQRPDLWRLTLGQLGSSEGSGFMGVAVIVAIGINGLFFTCVIVSLVKTRGRAQKFSKNPSS